MSNTTPLFAALTAALLTTPALAGDAPSKGLEPAELIAKVKPALVQVEYTLQFDKGEAPRPLNSRWARWGARGNASQVVKQERPLQTSGYLLNGTTVVTADPMIQSRFVKSIRVKFQGGEGVTATPLGYGRDQCAMFLKLSSTLEGARPLSGWKPGAKKPLKAIVYERTSTGWVTRLTGFGSGVAVTDRGEELISAWADSLVVDKHGNPVGVTFKSSLKKAEAWKGSPLKWDRFTTKALEGHMQKLAAEWGQGIVRVHLTFRSPKNRNSSSRFSFGGGGQASATEWNGLGLLAPGNKVLILADLKPKQTARLSKIELFQGKTQVQAQFVASLTDYGAFVAKLDTPLPLGARYSTKNIRDYRDTLILINEASIQGKTRTDHYARSWFHSVQIGWRQHVSPSVTTQVADRSSNYNSTTKRGVFLYSLDGYLLALPIKRREKVTVRRRWSSSESAITPIKYVNAVLQDLKGDTIDVNNVPLNEEDENRLAWLGVEMQPLNRDLARANGVADITNDGSSGAVVVHIYPNSPATKAGLQEDDVLIRLHVDGQPKPLEVKLDSNRFGMSFPWDRLDQIPDSYFDRIPQPWPAAENTFTKALTELGFGKKFTAEVFRDGKLLKIKMVVTSSPKHYVAAPRYKSESLGLTVANLTYEVQRYFRKKATDPGVIAAKIERGGKLSVAGLKPYEIVTHVNDQPVNSVDAFKRLIHEKPGELRLSVKRMHKGRIVKVTITDGDLKKDAEHDAKKAKASGKKPATKSKK